MSGYSSETLALVRAALANATPDSLNKAYTGTFAQPGSATVGLQNYDLEHVVRSFVPMFSPLRNRIARVKASGGTQANWKAVVAVDSGQQYSGIEEGRRGGLIDTLTQDYYAAYRTLGRESSVSFEAELSAEGFDDLRSRAVMNLLNKTMEEEEKILLGGNSINALGISPTPTCTTANTGGSIAASTTVSVICVALNFDAFRRFQGKTSIVQSVTRANQDATSTTVNAGTARPSTAGSIATAAGTATNAVTAKVTPMRGAYGYAWFAGAAGSERLVAITNVSQVVVTAMPGSGQLASTLTATDNSTDTLIHDGLLGFCGNASLGCYYNAVAAGATLTADGAGGIVEFDNALQTFWDVQRVTPDRILISSQEAVTIKKIIMLQGVQTSLSRFNFQQSQGGMTGGALAKGYLTPFGTQKEIPFEQHPFMPAGTVLFVTENLPYPMNNVNNIMEVQNRKDYWQTEWPLRTRSYEFGVYTDQVLKHYYPPSMGIITNLSKA